MALDATALASLEEVKDYLRIQGDTRDAQIEKTINRVSARMEQYLTFPVKQRQVTDVRTCARESQILRAYAAPIAVAQPVTIAIEGLATQTVWRTEADGPTTGFDVILASDIDDPLWRPNLFYRRGGWDVGGDHPSPITLTYVGGFSPVPADLLEAFFLIVQKYDMEQSKGLQELVTVNTPSGGVTLFDRPIPFRALQILNEWRGFRV